MPRKAGRKGQGPVRSADEPSAGVNGYADRSDSESGSESDTNGSPSYENAVNLPAHQTKHLAELTYRFPSIDASFKIVQRNDTNSTGSSLWLSSQVLSSYLIHTYAKAQQSNARTTRRRMLELGSGTGLLSLLMASLGWQVTATDIPPVLDSVLRPNVQAGLYRLVNAGTIVPEQLHIAELDWMVPGERWLWHPQFGFPSTEEHTDSSDTSIPAEPHFDLILTADTIYEPSLIRPLLSTIAHLYMRQDGSRPTVLLALERRDPAHITEALRIAHQEYSLNFKQVPVKRVRKIFDTFGDGATWSRKDWDGVEIWKL
ncbi:uncharacterized protein UTRI_05034_B [Ustilago trichophora]|uniref:Uncharacterized protein n=1 Tax=Ustilago trichophora TaxID=86804 RepID=A0A5C3EHF7_9BASI|nr:uncharacterized protein UTRI_05034_B [Ustilago trichophora]